MFRYRKRLGTAVILAITTMSAAITVALSVGTTSAFAASCPGSGINVYQLGYYRDHHVPVLGSYMRDSIIAGVSTVYSGLVGEYISVGDPHNSTNTWMQAGMTKQGSSGAIHPYIEVYDNGVKVKQTVYTGTTLNAGTSYTFTIDHFSGGDYHAIVPGGGNTFTYGFNDSPVEQDALTEIQNPNQTCNVVSNNFSGVTWGSGCSCTTASIYPTPNPYNLSAYDPVSGFHVVGP